MERKKIEIKAEDVPTIKMNTITLDVVLTDVWGGDGFDRFQEIKTQKINKVKTKTIQTNTMPGLTSSRKTEEIVTEVGLVPVATFELNNKEQPILPFGRKIRGTLKANGTSLFNLEHPLFPFKNRVIDMIRMITVEPEYLVVSEDKNWRENGNYYFATSPQPLNGGRGSFIGKHYDAVKEVETTVIIKYPSVYHDQVKAMISLLESTKTLNRGMTKIQVNSMKET